MRAPKAKMDERREKALVFLSTGITSTDFCKVFKMPKNDMSKFFARLKSKGCVITKTQLPKRESFWKLETPLSKALSLMEFGETKISIQTANKKNPYTHKVNPYSKTKMVHYDTPWFILTR